MIFSPEDAYKNGWISFIDPSNVQQNGIDLRIKKVFVANTRDNLVVPSMKKSVETMELEPRTVIEYGYPIDDFKFNEYWSVFGTAIFIESYEYIQVPIDVCAMIFTRSTPNRSGAFSLSGLYDSGFEGPIRFTFYPHFPDLNFILGKGDSSLAQVVFMEAKSASVYNGIYKDRKSK